MDKTRNLIVLGSAINAKKYQLDKVALDIESMRIIHIRIDESDCMVDLVALSMDYPILIDAILENSRREIWIAHRARLRNEEEGERVRKILSTKASFPYNFLNSGFHLRYGLGKLRSFELLEWKENRLWMKNALLAGTDIRRTILLYGDIFAKMIDSDNRLVLEKQMQDWSNDVFCVLARLDVERKSYCFSNILIMGK